MRLLLFTPNPSLRGAERRGIPRFKSLYTISHSTSLRGTKQSSIGRAALQADDCHAPLAMTCWVKLARDIRFRLQQPQIWLHRLL
jgi:hypothetical protein